MRRDERPHEGGTIRSRPRRVSGARSTPSITVAAMTAAPAPPVLADAAVDAVLAWYDAHARDLPWRMPGASPWGILVSEIMLQQTPVVRVLPRWIAWMERWPEPRDLAEAPTADVLRAWDSLGYPRRALRLQECARTIVGEHGGVVPSTVEELRALPGIGEYTAGAVAAFAFGRRAMVADTNVRRVVERALAGRALPRPHLTAAERHVLTAQVPVDTQRSVRWNQAVMELGALVCTARSPACEACPLAAHGCAYLAAGRPAPIAGDRRTQAFEGTDRQMRGRIMKALREAHPRSVATTALLSLDESDRARVERCIASLVADRLAVMADDALRLPA